MESKKNRNSNIELLRIVAMIGIIAHHISLHGMDFHTNYILFNKIIRDIMIIGGKFGVLIFFIISGYYTLDSKFTFKKFMIIAGETFFYSFGIFLIFHQKYDFYISYLFPISYLEYGFVTQYIVLMLLSPFINIMVKNIDKKNYLLLMLTLFIIESMIPYYLESNINRFGIDISILAYLIGAGIKQFKLDDYNYKKTYFTFFNISLIIIISFSIINTLFSESQILYSDYSPYIIILSISAFLYAISLPQKNNKTINIIASGTFGIYLLHDHNITRNVIWIDIFKTYAFSNSPYMFPYILCAILIIFCLRIGYRSIETNIN